VRPTGARTFDVKQVALASLSSVLGAVMTVAVGGGVAMTFLSMALAPWLTALVEHPGPHRRRRVALIVVFAFVVFACRWLLSQVGMLLRKPPGRRRCEASPASAQTCF
jgi:peptidoglycan biosynthesis protein MviN/MurJ (putative lipid II flippase)